MVFEAGLFELSRQKRLLQPLLKKTTSTQVGFEDLSRLDSILPLSRKDLRRQNLVPEGDKYRIQFPEKKRQITFLLSLEKNFGIGIHDTCNYNGITYAQFTLTKKISSNQLFSNFFFLSHCFHEIFAKKVLRHSVW